MQSLLYGRKAYIVGAGMILVAVGQWLQLDTPSVDEILSGNPLRMLLEGLSVIAIRAGIAKV